MLGGSPPQFGFTAVVGQERMYFYGKKLFTTEDNVGSAAISPTYRAQSFYPYGEQKSGPTATEQYAFATYWRDGESGLDYAWNRYYSSTLGRFLSPDPYKANNGGPGDPSDPQSWNRYSYAANDPVNLFDPEGTTNCGSSFSQGSDGVMYLTVYECQVPSVSLFSLPSPVEGLSGYLLITMEEKLDAAAGNPGIALAKSDLSQIASGAFEKKGPCGDFFQALIKELGLDMSVSTLESELTKTAADAENDVYNGPSSSTQLTNDKFPGIASSGVATVGDWFNANPGAQALSQFNGSAIWIRSGDWSPSLFGWISSSFSGQYGLGTMMHELLHKESVGGGFNHDAMNAALTAVGMSPGNYPLGDNRISYQLGQLCF
jgi:RHS repeat-associated protein